jgi:beta-N-acetylhexosaminidase
MNKKYGQLIMTGISSTTLNKEESDFLKNNDIGGVILFKNNYEDPAQLAELVNDIQKCRDEYPLFIGVDQEGGRVRRFQNNFIQLPPMLEIAKQDSPKLIFELHEVMAKELRACGVNLNFAPVCDILTNPSNKVIGDRAFGDNVESVEKFISAAIRGLHKENVLACAKHFPGHGNTTKDSHFDLPYVKRSLVELESEEILPFIKASKSRVEFIMMAHLVVDAIDEQLPCTVSSKAYKYLRSKLKYDKIIITDDMEMKGITDHFTIDNPGKAAIQAGADIILYRSMSMADEALQAINRAMELKQMNQEVIEPKLKRIMNCKKAFLSDYQPIYIPDISKSFPSTQVQMLLDLLNKE